MRTLRALRIDLRWGLLAVLEGCASGQPAPRTEAAPRIEAATTTLFRVCADQAGAVTRVEVVRPSGRPDRDEEFARKMRAWKREPLVRNGVAVPYCTSVKVDVVPSDAGVEARPDASSAADRRGS
jgi:hypothetical protein